MFASLRFVCIFYNLGLYALYGYGPDIQTNLQTGLILFLQASGEREALVFFFLLSTSQEKSSLARSGFCTFEVEKILPIFCVWVIVIAGRR